MSDASGLRRNPRGRHAPLTLPCRSLLPAGFPGHRCPALGLPSWGSGRSEPSVSEKSLRGQPVDRTSTEGGAGAARVCPLRGRGLCCVFPIVGGSPVQLASYEVTLPKAPPPVAFPTTTNRPRGTTGLRRAVGKVPSRQPWREASVDGPAGFPRQHYDPGFVPAGTDHGRRPHKHVFWLLLIVTACPRKPRGCVSLGVHATRSSRRTTTTHPSVPDAGTQFCLHTDVAKAPHVRPACRVLTVARGDRGLAQPATTRTTRHWQQTGMGRDREHFVSTFLFLETPGAQNPRDGLFLSRFRYDFASGNPKVAPTPPVGLFLLLVFWLFHWMPEMLSKSKTAPMDSDQRENINVFAKL